MDNEQELVAAILKGTPRPEVRADFVARVNARIDAASGWFGLADFRVWTLRLAPAAGALALVAVFWPAPAASSTSASTTSTSTTAAPAVQTETAPASTFSPASSSDWQHDVSADALLDAALRPAGGGNVR
jgi:hypothetical protein